MSKFKDDILVITGGTGFLGKQFMKLIDKDDFKEVRVIRSKKHDIRDPEKCFEALKGATLIVHIAGITGGIEFTKLNQGRVYYDNIRMNTNVLEAARINNVKKVVSVGTVCSYPKCPSVPFKEEEIWQGYPEESIAPYGMAKKMLIVQGDAYKAQYNLNSQVLLFTNLYGPSDTFDKDRSHVIPALITKFHDAIKNGQPAVTLWGDGSATRDLLYVEDAANAIKLALYSDSTVSPINIGTGVETSIKHLAETMRELMPGNYNIVWDTTKPNGQPRRVLDITRAREQLKYEPLFSLKEGLKKTIAWYNENNG